VFHEPRLILPAVWDAVSARAAHSAGARALFLSGSALAGSFGFPDIGLVPPDDLVRTTSRIRSATDLPLIVDAECGFGGLPQLAKEARALHSAGATGILIEDQGFTGQSVSVSNPGLCAAGVMVERIRVAKDATSPEFVVLARTDVIGADWVFEETIGRLEQYVQAGADRLTAVFVRSRDELELAAQVGAGRLIGIAVPGATGYIPDPADAFSVGCSGVVVTGFLQGAFRELQSLYELALAEETAALRGRQPSRQEFEADMGFARFDRPTTPAAAAARPPSSGS
jgi:methylisocitrate lyase